MIDYFCFADYVNFIKKAIVLAQHFPDVLRIELSMKPDKQQIREEVVVPNKAAQAAKMPGILPGVLQTNSGAQFARKLEDEVLDDGDDDNEDIIGKWPLMIRILKTPSVSERWWGG